MADTLPAITPLEGTTTVDDKMSFEPERLSYDAAHHVAMSIAREVEKAVKDRSVVIAGTSFLADLGNLATSNLQLEMLTNDYRGIAATLAPSAPVPRDSKPPGLESLVAAPAVMAGFQAALGVVSLLRENVEFKGVPTRVDALAFEIDLASAMRSAGAAKVFVPDLMVIRAPQQTATSLQGRLAEMQKARHAAWRAAGPIVAELGRKDAELDAASRSGTPADVARLSQEVFALRRNAEPLTQTLSQADRRLADLQSQWDRASDTTGLTMLARLLRAEALEALTPPPVYLHAAVVSSGGHHRVSRHLFRMIFLGDGLSSMGGVVVRWTLLESGAAIQQGGVLSMRSVAKFPSIFDVP